MFYYYNHITKPESDWGSIGISHVAFMPKELREKIPEIVFDENNLGYMFQEDLSDIDNHINTCDRFIPPLLDGQTVSDYISLQGVTNKNFYSFLAEGLLSLVYKDITGYKIAKAVIDIDGTLNDSHTGADACMYDEANNLIVLGEAKFYKTSASNGIHAIINDFTKNKIVNKLESLYNISTKRGVTKKILMHNLGTGAHEEISISQFLGQKIVFAGFVLHDEDDSNIKDYMNPSRYDCFKIDAEKINKNIENSFKRIKLAHHNYEIVIVHLPIDSKDQLINDVIEKAQNERRRLEKCLIP